MPEYDAVHFDPPAPIAYATLRNPLTGKILSDVPLLIDTGADATLLPQKAADQLGVETDDADFLEVQGFSGESTPLPLVKLELYLLDKKFTGEFLLVDQPMGILGRNILNNLCIVLDGPRGNWSEQKSL